jgi:hypothetical protein
MDGRRFDAWTRRRFNLVAGGGLTALLGLGGLPLGESDARKRRKRPSKKRRCRQKANRIWCDGTCVQGECCPDQVCGSDPACNCRRTIEGQTACMANAVVLCEGGCARNADCAEGWACLPTSCGGLTGLCFPRCGTLP